MVVVEDDGQGFALDAVRVSAGKLGLVGIEERAALLGGSACVESQPGEGTQIFVEIPLPAS